MKLEWLGRYRELIEKTIKFGNAYGNIIKKEADYGTSVSFTPPQLQVMEYILENEEKNQSMAQIAERLGMSPSSFSKNVKKMLDKGPLEKYHTSSNKKNIIVRISPFGREVYDAYCRRMKLRTFDKMFEILDGVSQEDLDKVAQALELWANDLSTKRHVSDEEELIRIE